MGPKKKKAKQTMKRKEADIIGSVENLRESILVFFSSLFVFLRFTKI